MKIFLRLLSLLSPLWWWMALAILLGSATVASNMGLLSMAAYLIAAAALAPLLVTLTLPIYIVRFMGVSRAVARYTERLVSHNATFRILARLRTWFYARLEPLAPAQLQAYRSGDLLARLVSDIEELQNMYLRIVSPLVVLLAIIMLTFGVFSIFSPLLAWVAVAFLGGAGLGIPLLVRALSRGLGKRQLVLRAELKAQIVDGLQGVQDILACGRAGDQQQKITDLDRELGRLQGHMAFITGLQQAMNELLMNLALWTILVLSIPLITTRSINGVYLAFLALLILASFEAVQPLGQAFQFLGHTLTAGERVFGVIDTPVQVVESASPLPTPQSSQVHVLEFEQVCFAYQPGEDYVLHDITFSLHPGEHIAIVGPSGAGKSTLVSLALRFWDPTSGTVRLDGHNIQHYRLNDLHSCISVVAQDTHLFNDTIRGNLLLARSGASAEELEQALEQAQLTEFIRKLPKGLDTWVGEQGLRLSGGERQRLAIARALLKNASLLILDEATANLDPLTEQGILEALHTLMQGRTTLMITHRLIGLERMHEILVFDRGNVIERGTQEQLLAAEGLYRRLYDVQNSILVVGGSGHSNVNLPRDDA